MKITKRQATNDFKVRGTFISTGNMFLIFKTGDIDLIYIGDTGLKYMSIYNEEVESSKKDCFMTISDMIGMHKNIIQNTVNI